MEIGNTIKLILKFKNIKQKDFCKMIPISNNTLSQIITNNTFPSEYNLSRICVLLEIPKHFLFFVCITNDEIPENKKEIWNLMKPMFEQFLINIYSKSNIQKIKYQQFLNHFKYEN